jgi:hypothetical protein
MDRRVATAIRDRNDNPPGATPAGFSWPARRTRRAIPLTRRNSVGIIAAV